MNSALFLFLATLSASNITARSQDNSGAGPTTEASAKAKSNADIEKKAAEWVGSLKLDNAAKATRVTEVVATHLKTIRDWHNEHPYTTVPAGLNPVTGRPLSEIDRQFIADSANPARIFGDNFIAALTKDLNHEQVEAILDKHTVGKVAFTMKGYKAIVPDLTAEEEKTILGFLKQARAEAIIYKNMAQISVVFEIYKTKSEQYLNANGRDWKKMYKTYTDTAKAKKAEAAQKPADSNP